jgi:hypothetical protein
VPAEITVKSERSESRATRRPQAGALFTVILVGSRLERREDGRFLGGCSRRTYCQAQRSWLFQPTVCEPTAAVNPFRVLLVICAAIGAICGCPIADNRAEKQ